MANSIIPANPLANVSGIEFVPGTTSNSFTVNFVNGNVFRIIVGRLDTSTNYAQFFLNGVDKGYIRFDVSRNV